MGNYRVERRGRETPAYQRQRRMAMAQWKKENAPCHLCGKPIDYDAHYLDPFAPTMDHLVPINRGGPAITKDIAPAHRRCNRDRSDALLSESWGRGNRTGKPSPRLKWSRAWYSREEWEEWADVDEEPPIILRDSW